MKRLILFMFLAGALQTDMNAQKSDGFFGYDSKYEGYDSKYEIADGYKFYDKDNSSIKTIAKENNAPLGSGMLLLSAMGIAYCVAKKHRR